MKKYSSILFTKTFYWRKNFILVRLIMIFTLGMYSCKTPSTLINTPELKLPEKFASSKDSTTMGNISWKNFFKDDYLVAHIDTAINNNQDLKIALQRIEMYKAEVLRAEGFLKPSVGFGNVNSLRRFGLYTMDGAGNISTDMLPGKIVPINLPDFLLGFNSSWEIDIWGKLRSQKKASVSRFLSSMEGNKWLKTNLVTSVALIYYDLMTLDRELQLINETILKQEEALEVVKLQKEAGVGSELPIQQFTASLLNFKAMAQHINMEIVEKEILMNQLMGKLPQPILRRTNGIEDKIQETLEIGFPSQLLSNRPDIKNAEYRIAASKYNLEAARTAFLPSVNLTAGLGFQAFNPRFLFNTPASIAYSLVGGLTGPLINKNAIQANFNISKSEQIEAIYEYQKSVINAFAEVTNELNTLENLKEIELLKNSESIEMEKVIETSRQLFRTGRANYLEVLLAQQNALKTNIERYEVKKHQQQSLIRLYKSLGGGWN
jgi:multidrug efflux system outer membrane protein